MIDNSDNWPPHYNIGQPNHIHALGMASAMYNQMELSLQLLLTAYSGLGNDTTQWLASNLSNNLRLELLKRCAEDREKNSATKDAILHFARCFDICAENRNFLMHSMVKTPTNEEILSLAKASRNNPKKFNEIDLELDDIRRVADEIASISSYGGQLYAYFLFTNFDQSHIPQHIREFASTLPGKPPLPDKLLKPSRPNP